MSAIAKGNDPEAAASWKAFTNPCTGRRWRSAGGSGRIHARPPADRKRADELRDSFERYKGSLPLIAETYAAMLEKVSDDPEPYRAYLERPGREPIIRLTEVMQVDEPWQRALDHLQTLLVAPAEAQEPVKKKGKRLIWLVDPDIGTIEPVEQTAKRDGWNTGRRCPSAASSRTTRRSNWTRTTGA